MKKYLELVHEILTHGHSDHNRTDTRATYIFGKMLSFDLQEGFPILTTKKIHWQSVVHELLWFLTGKEDIHYLHDNNVHIWDAWADEQLSVGPMYGSQWINWDHSNLNQIDKALELLKHNPRSRRIIISAWNPKVIPDDIIPPKDNPAKGLMALAPCHVLIQLCVTDGKLSCLFFQRSVDVFLGLPFNIASYALLTHMLAQQSELEVDKLIFTGGNCHLYDNHVAQSQIQLTRAPYPLPKLRICRKPASIYEYKFSDFMLEGYQHHPALPAKISV